MTKTNNLTQKKIIWEPQFMESIQQNICLNCDKNFEISGRNALKMQSANQDKNISQHQIITISDPKQCADCEVYTIGNTEFYTHYSSSV